MTRGAEREREIVGFIYLFSLPRTIEYYYYSLHAVVVVFESRFLLLWYVINKSQLLGYIIYSSSPGRFCFGINLK